MCYLHRGFILEIASPTGSFFRGITSLQRISGEFRCATITTSLSLRYLSHGHDGSYEGWDEKTATIGQRTCDLPLPMLNDVTMTYDDNNGRGGLIINQNDDDDGDMGSDFEDKLNVDDS